ncbi:hypothetical protein [Nonomuraea sp. NPDC052265]|uniref:hypothetical protein n=1 Tax=Nonomuraea sp. NPDC052265 TaxID=3364374 RepID=UPI0037C8A9FB
MSEDVIDARALLPDLDGFPPPLYLSPEVGDPLADVLPLIAHLGLPPVKVTVDGGHATMSLYQAQGEQWRITIGARREVEVRCPGPAGGDLALLSGVRITDPAAWCGEVLRHQAALIFVGPPLPWRREEAGLSRVLAMLGRRAACAGVVPAQLANPGSGGR